MLHYAKSFTLIVAFLSLSIITNAQHNIKKSLFVIVDGIPADVIEKVNTPNLNLIAKQGKYIKLYVGGEKGGYTQTPTISAVGYNSLLTGTWVNKHNVWGNDIKAPNYNYPSIFRLLKDQYPDKKAAIYSSWLDNRTKLAGDGLAATNHLKIDYHADGYESDTTNYRHDKDGLYMHLIDEKVVAEAVSGIKQHAPDLSWVYLEYTDDMGHKFGDSPQYYNAVEMMDKQIGSLWQAILYRQKHFNEDWLIFVTTDHGRDEKTGKSHGGQTARQRSTWTVTNAKDLNNYAKRGNPAIVDIMPSIAQFMNINIAEKYRNEIDGTPLTGLVSVASPTANFIQGNIDISWKALNEGEKIKIWVAAANNFKEGKPDDYKLMTEVPIGQEHVQISVKDMPSAFYKVVIEGKYNSVNRWVTLEPKN
jgi:predicted AlkP superfamily pyrophosphatase or phosphodiesterase